MVSAVTRFCYQGCRGRTIGFRNCRPRGPRLQSSNQIYIYDYSAYRLVNGRLTYWPIRAKQNQDFVSYATSFERWASKLVSVHHLLDPVVDENLMVVGHVGFLNAKFFFKLPGLDAWEPTPIR